MASFTILDPDQFFKDLPLLATASFQRTSAATDRYNCVAFALGDRTRKWWPSLDGCWLPGLVLAETVEAFVALFERLDYRRCQGKAFEDGYEKIAIFANQNGPQHVARQPTDRGGRWRSKIGDNLDIEHDLEDLAGPLYGRVVVVMRRPIGRDARRARVVKSGRRGSARANS